MTILHKPPCTIITIICYSLIRNFVYQYSVHEGRINKFWTGTECQINLECHQSIKEDYSSKIRASLEHHSVDRLPLPPLSLPWCDLHTCHNNPPRFVPTIVRCKSIRHYCTGPGNTYHFTLSALNHREYCRKWSHDSRTNPKVLFRRLAGGVEFSSQIKTTERQFAPRKWLNAWHIQGTNGVCFLGRWNS